MSEKEKSFPAHVTGFSAGMEALLASGEEAELAQNKQQANKSHAARAEKMNMELILF